ncbi:GNAT family N-acetyltransferase [Inquilinus limosus]|uniref:GNAT family N-acetyltransferase n=1 Tax=Inquilinus limosus TaxID=171674 RepID=UPI001EE6F57D|nr:GNAT family N-acetyltransferase [Inquilinus limosus]
MSAAGAAGTLTVTVTQLEMTARPARPAPPPPLARHLLMRAEPATVSFYRYLYDTIGANWLWTDRREWDDERLAVRLNDERTGVYVLYVAGVPAGYGELFQESVEVTDLAYFGLMPDFIGRRLGPFLLWSMIDLAWARPIRRMTVDTCTLDHPKALAHYQRAGFIPYAQRVVHKADPRLTGLLPRTAAPHIPLAG